MHLLWVVLFQLNNNLSYGKPVYKSRYTGSACSDQQIPYYYRKIWQHDGNQDPINQWGDYRSEAYPAIIQGYADLNNNQVLKKKKPLVDSSGYSKN
ncbi:MAG TPA: hypothetical protein VNX68_16120 [Nitrosopumilaceae archaeon]|nr:hypothetical protein [Nitrosopumilaceae archaeon]